MDAHQRVALAVEPVAAAEYGDGEGMLIKRRAAAAQRLFHHVAQETAQGGRGPDRRPREDPFQVGAHGLRIATVSVAAGCHTASDVAAAFWCRVRAGRRVLI